MDEIKIVISREAVHNLHLKKYTVEVDGKAVGVLENGGNLVIPISEGTHVVSFFARKKCERTVTIQTNGSTPIYEIRTKINKVNGKFEVYTSADWFSSLDNGQNKKSKHSALESVLIAIAVVIFSMFVIISIASSDSDDKVSVSVASQSDSNSENTKDASQNDNNGNDDVIIYYDDNYTVTFTELEDMGLDDLGVSMYTMTLMVENNSDQNIAATLHDSYVNNTQVTFLGGSSGLSLDGVEHGKKAYLVYSFGAANLNLSSIEDIKTVEFSIHFNNAEDFSTILETDKIVLELS